MMFVIRHHAKWGEYDSLVSHQSLVTSCYFRTTWWQRFLSWFSASGREER